MDIVDAGRGPIQHSPLPVAVEGEESLDPGPHRPPGLNWPPPQTLGKPTSVSPHLGSSGAADHEYHDHS
jgi:hypothetical protein